MRTSLVRALHIAVRKSIGGVAAEQIYIIFINAPPEDEPHYHSAKTLAEELHFENPGLYSSEYLAEWQIEPKAIQHSMTLKTLIGRGLFPRWDESKRKFGHVEDLRNKVGKTLFNGYQTAYKLGLGLGLVARKFGAKALSMDIARKLLDEVIRPRFIDYRPINADRLAASQGINTAIIDWCLYDDEFMRSIKHHYRWAD